MAKQLKKTVPITGTGDLKPDAANPRKIGESAERGLAASLDKFGDLSGIVWNRRTGELVAGHQRMRQIEAKWGPQEIALVDEAAGLYGIRIDDSHFFAVRVVDWTKAKQRAANVAANSQKIAGEFTDDLAEFLLEVKDEIEQEDSTLFDDVLLAELVDPKGSGSEETKDAKLSESFQIIVQCNGEDHQREVYDSLSKQGLACRVLTI